VTAPAPDRQGQDATADIVIVGGGTAGCILAARLSEDASRRVLLLEAGPPDRDPWIRLPAGYAKLYASGKYDWRYETEPEPNLQDRRIHWPRGRVLGGSGSVNGLVFLRGSPHDYDRWAQAGATGWAYRDVEPVFRRIETWDGAPDAARGTDGAIHVREPRRLAPAAAAFVEACIAAGLPRNRDWNDGRPIDGAGPVQLNVNGGARSSTAREYLRPVMRRANLRVETGVTATRILVQDGRAVAVEALQDGRPVTFRAAREVVCSAGAIETPKLLMLSGIGDGAALQGLGIPVVHHSPQVGRNLQDHLIAKFIFRSKPCGTLNEILQSPWRKARMGLDYLLSRAGPLAIGAGEANAFARVTPGAEEAEVQFLFVNFSTFDYMKGLQDFPGFMFNYGACRPDSRGEVFLRSPDMRDKPGIRANYLDHPNDVRVMLGAARLGRRIAQQSPLAALIEQELRPGPDATTDEALLASIRATAGTVFHPCGTAAMGAVLDPQLRLRGVDGLRVADASAFPLIPSPNIQPAVMLVAERAAAFIRAAA
jgi:choline dehydrogenase